MHMLQSQHTLEGCNPLPAEAPAQHAEPVRGALMRMTRGCERGSWHQQEGVMYTEAGVAICSQDTCSCMTAHLDLKAGDVAALGLGQDGSTNVRQCHIRNGDEVV